MDLVGLVPQRKHVIAPTEPVLGTYLGIISLML